MGVGYDNVNIQYAGKLGIPVVNIPDYGTEEVADHALSLILGLYRGTFSSMKRVDQGDRIQGKVTRYKNNKQINVLNTKPTKQPCNMKRARGELLQTVKI